MSRYLILFSLLVLVLVACGICERGSDKEQIQKSVSSLSSYERKALSSFFRLLLETECCGYSLYGEKPLCVLEFTKGEIPLAMNENLIKRSSLLREGIRIWEKSGLASFKSNYALHASQLPSSDGWLDVFFINKQSLIHVIDQNLALFQYILGPKVSSVSLLNHFLDTNQNLSSILCEDRVLNGLVLGYGRQNAFHGSRLEYLNERGENENPKIARIKSHLPSFGFSNVLEEKDYFKHELFITTDKANELPRLPWFSAIAHKETDKLLEQYQATKKKLKKILASPYFLEETLSQFFGARIHLPPSKGILKLLLLEKLQKEKNIAVLLGQDLWSSLQKENATSEEIGDFIRGILDGVGEREDLSLLLREYHNNNHSRENGRLLYRLGQKIRDQYKPLGSIAPLEEIAASVRELKTSEISQQKRWEIIDQSNLLVHLLGETTFD